MNVLDFQKYKDEGRKISMVTCYDYSSARAVNASKVDTVLVGDSLAMTMHGMPDTLGATTELMALHTRAVRRGAPDKFIVADMPFLSFRKGIAPALDCVRELMVAGANAVKLEGVSGHEGVIAAIVGSGVPVMGHLGLTPQSVHQLGGMKVQARDEAAAEMLMAQARELEKLGCFSLVLECIPSGAGRAVSAQLKIPTIGIGAGPDCGGQVLVYQDLLGLNPGFKPKFLRTYANEFENVQSALDRYHADVQSGSFPNGKESYA